MRKGFSPKKQMNEALKNLENWKNLGFSEHDTWTSIQLDTEEAHFNFLALDQSLPKTDTGLVTPTASVPPMADKKHDFCSVPSISDKIFDLNAVPVAVGLSNASLSPTLTGRVNDRLANTVKRFVGGNVTNPFTCYVGVFKVSTHWDVTHFDILRGDTAAQSMHWMHKLAAHLAAFHIAKLKHADAPAAKDAP